MDAPWGIGDLASAAGVTVRTLRHYEQIGLLDEPERSSGMHRRYTDADVERLYRIVALRSLGLGLDAIATALDGTAPQLLELMHRQLSQVDERIEQDRRLRERLRAITAAFPSGQPAAATLLDLMELIRMADTTTVQVERLLRSGGHLTTGHITNVTRAELTGDNSRITRLLLEYSTEADPANAPPRLMLKENLPLAWAVAAGAQEVTFYRTIAGLADHPDLVPTSWGAAYDMVSGDSQILLADLSDSHHRATRDRDAQVAGDVPSDETCDQVIDTLARLHAYWWDHPLLRDGVFPLLDFNGDWTRWVAYEQHRRRSWESVSAGSHPVPAAGREAVEHILSTFGRHWDAYMRDRVAERRALTLMHGDTYFVNFLVPNDGSTASPVLLDWQCPSGNIGAFDLANLCTTFWSSEQRQQNGRELRMLQRYHAELVARGVSGYSWDDLCHDYRAGIIYWLLVPIQDAHDGSAPAYWTPKLTCLTEAFHDWDCQSLL